MTIFLTYIAICLFLFACLIFLLTIKEECIACMITVAAIILLATTLYLGADPVRMDNANNSVKQLLQLSNK